MSVDSYFTIGSTHDVCEDYAIGSYPMLEPSFVVVCDGCSSAANSDIGARILAISAQHELRKENSFDADSFFNRVNDSSHIFCRTMDIDPDVLLATLLVITRVGDYMKVLMYGDGLWAMEDMAGIITVKEHEFVTNAPYYLRYDRDKQSKQSYLDVFGIEKRCNTYRIDLDGNCEKVESNRVAMDVHKPYIEETIHITECSTLAVMSDGASSFVDNSEGKMKTVQTEDVLPDILRFKNSNGVFVKRRIKKAMKKWQSIGYQHTDDLSIGAVTTGIITS